MDLGINEADRVGRAAGGPNSVQEQIKSRCELGRLVATYFGIYYSAHFATRMLEVTLHRTAALQIAYCVSNVFTERVGVPKTLYSLIFVFERYRGRITAAVSAVLKDSLMVFFIFPRIFFSEPVLECNRCFPNSLNSLVLCHRFTRLCIMLYILHKLYIFPVWESEFNGLGGSATMTTRHPSIHKCWHYNLSTCGCSSVGIVRLRTESHGIYCIYYSYWYHH
jgi:hypothetical protein